MKERQVQSDCEREQMALNRENNFREQQKLRLLNQQLQAQVAALQINLTQTGYELENNQSPNLFAFDELI